MALRRISTAGGSVRRSPVIVLAGKVNVSWTPSPPWRAVRSVTGVGTGGEGGVGSPGAPQPAKSKEAKMETRNEDSGKTMRLGGARVSLIHFEFRSLKNVAAQILVLDDFRELLGHVGGIDLHIFLFQVGSLKGELVENLFQNGVQAARADVFGLFVDAGGKFGDGLDGVLRDVELDAFGFEQ